jgi:hypothetical protein
MVMKLVLLYSTDGFDLDVLENQKDLYTSIGYKVIWGSRLIQCDLIVVLRCEMNDVISIPKSTPVLFLDYSGQDVLTVYNNTDGKYKYCITSQKYYHDAKTIFFGHPYVSIDRYSLPLSELRYDYVHIGNYKKGRWIDVLQVSFIRYCKDVGCHVWGKGWTEEDLSRLNYYGALRPEKVSEIYSSSKIALGVKHNFQIGKSISGRYWHAPLNGCLLLVEDEYLVGEIPGIYLYTNSECSISREEIQAEARVFWNKSNELQKELSLKLMREAHTENWKKILYFLIYKYYSILYEKYRLWTYGKK